MALNIELRVGESVKIGDATITLADKSGKIARLSIDAPKSVPIDRQPQSSAAKIAATMGLSADPT
ncbi:CsrA-like regulator protein [Burkholderia phage Bcep22]|uniref:CsrA-like regulator protein n=1 Tax=Burkholderia phage Bcep22 TaxID=2883944 RepID=Q6V7N9_9CAUD|nr:CsrA-like regulator [Burkholderia phage Bcep22]AAQ54987.1 CsrA-like regulator protein [Burkholderia phage Bcep22]